MTAFPASVAKESMSSATVRFIKLLGCLFMKVRNSGRSGHSIVDGMYSLQKLSPCSSPSGCELVSLSPVLLEETTLSSWWTAKCCIACKLGRDGGIHGVLCRRTSVTQTQYLFSLQYNHNLTVLLEYL